MSTLIAVLAVLPFLFAAVGIVVALMGKGIDLDNSEKLA